MRVTDRNLTSVLEECSKHQTLAVDTETTGLEERDVPFALITATTHDTFYFDERVLPSFWANVAPLLADTSKTFVFQNAKFDMRMLATKGLPIHGSVVDIAIASRLLRNDQLVHSLDAQAKRLLGQEKDTTVAKYIKDFDLYETRTYPLGGTYKVPRYDRVPIEIMETYAQKDARLTFDLYELYMSRLDVDSLRVWNNENDLIKVFYKMERRGLLLNQEYTVAAREHEQVRLDTFKALYKSFTGVGFVNSAKSIQKALDIQLPTTAAGNPSLTDDVIEELMDRGIRAKELGFVRNIRTHDKRISTYYDNYLNFHSNGIIHPTMWQAGTRTGRISYSDPNLQNVPKEEDSEDRYVVRGCFMPRPGRRYVSFDYKQMEYRMAAAYANERTAIDAVMGGADFHQATADLVGITRKQAKTLNFAILYGAGDEKVAKMLGVSLQEARRLRLKYFMALHKIEKLIDDVISKGRGRGYVVNWFGRRLYADKEFAYALPNHLIQGGGADVVKVAMNRIDEEFPSLWMVLQVHDQLVFEMTDEELAHIPRIKQIMESVWTKNGMVLEVDVSWSDKSLAERDMQPWK